MKSPVPSCTGDLYSGWTRPGNLEEGRRGDSPCNRDTCKHCRSDPKGRDLMCSPCSPAEDQQPSSAYLITSLAGEVCAAFYGTWELPTPKVLVSCTWTRVTQIFQWWISPEKREVGKVGSVYRRHFITTSQTCLIVGSGGPGIFLFEGDAQGAKELPAWSSALGKGHGHLHTGNPQD